MRFSLESHETCMYRGSLTSPILHSFNDTQQIMNAKPTGKIAAKFKVLF